MPDLFESHIVCFLMDNGAAHMYINTVDDFSKIIYIRLILQNYKETDKNVHLCSVNEPRQEKTKNVIAKQVRHEPSCRNIKDG